MVLYYDTLELVNIVHKRCLVEDEMVELIILLLKI